jgi:hypothetical protein
MARVVIAAALVIAAVIVAAVIEKRRRRDAPSQPRAIVPAQLDRADFARPDAAWLVAVFSSTTCDSCRQVVAAARVLASREVAVTDVEVTEQPRVHRRYHIDAVPITVIADAAGTVRASFIGPVTATDLWAAVAECRGPGPTPEPDLGQ